jgi:hypothetical protein
MLTSVKFTFPKTLFDVKTFDRTLINGLNKIIDATEKDFKATISTWDEKPSVYVTHAHKTGSTIGGSVWLDEPRYVGLNYGIPAHEIVARRAPMLRFRHGSGFSPKTVKGFIGSGPGRNEGPWVRKHSVSHPGVEGRRWDLAIAAKHRNDLIPIAEDAIEEATSE